MSGRSLTGCLQATFHKSPCNRPPFRIQKLLLSPLRAEKCQNIKCLRSENFFRRLHRRKNTLKSHIFGIFCILRDDFRHIHFPSKKFFFLKRRLQRRIRVLRALKYFNPNPDSDQNPAIQSSIMEKREVNNPLESGFGPSLSLRPHT